MSTAAPSLRTFHAGLLGSGLVGLLPSRACRPCHRPWRAGACRCARRRRLAASEPNLLLEHFTRAVLLARDESGDRRSRGGSALHVLPGLVRVGDRERRPSGPQRRGPGRGPWARASTRRRAQSTAEHDAVVAELHFDDVGDAGLGAIFLLGRLDLARRVGDVDLVLANAGAELLDASARAARLDDGRLEVRERLAELLGNDVARTEELVDDPATFT